MAESKNSSGVMTKLVKILLLLVMGKLSYMCQDKAQVLGRAKPSYHHVAHLLENGVRTLIYAGARDFIWFAFPVLL